MSRSSHLKFTCPSCGTKLAGIEPTEVATQVVARTCSKCGDRWQLIVKVIRPGVAFRVDSATFNFIDSRFTRAKGKLKVNS